MVGSITVTHSAANIANKFFFGHLQHVEAGGGVAARGAEGLFGDPAGDADLVEDVTAGLEDGEGVGHHVDLHEADRAFFERGSNGCGGLGGEFLVDLNKTVKHH